MKYTDTLIHFSSSTVYSRQSATKVPERMLLSTVYSSVTQLLQQLISHSCKGPLLFFGGYPNLCFPGAHEASLLPSFPVRRRAKRRPYIQNLLWAARVCVACRGRREGGGQNLLSESPRLTGKNEGITSESNTFCTSDTHHNLLHDTPPQGERK